MGLPIFLCIAIISVAAAKQGPGYIHCRCSPSGISTNSSDAYKFIEDSLSRLNEISGKIQPGIIGTDAGVEAARGIMKDCISKFKETPCIDADAALRSVHGKIPICYYNVESGKNIDGIGRILNNCDGNVVFNALKAKNEGCVAIEHLAGLKLQHLRNLKRPVLCHEGFCATPNHAIIVQGVGYTSMKRECSRTGKWHGECTRDEKLVNNLRLFYHREIKINEEITITPFDFRYPKAAVWAVHILQELPIFGIGLGICLLFTLSKRVIQLDWVRKYNSID